MTDPLSNHIALSGIILCTENFDECVEFYCEKLGLSLWFEKPGLCCLHFGKSYLMIEQSGMAAERKNKAQNPTTLRFNVEDVDQAVLALSSQNIPFERKTFDWGEVATFWDPDGNECELKNADDPYFEKGNPSQ